MVQMYVMDDVKRREWTKKVPGKRKERREKRKNTKRKEMSFWWKWKQNGIWMWRRWRMCEWTFLWYQWLLLITAGEGTVNTKRKENCENCEICENVKIFNTQEERKWDCELLWKWLKFIQKDKNSDCTAYSDVSNFQNYVCPPGSLLSLSLFFFLFLFFILFLFLVHFSFSVYYTVKIFLIPCERERVWNCANECEDECEDECEEMWGRMKKRRKSGKWEIDDMKGYGCLPQTIGMYTCQELYKGKEGDKKEEEMNISNDFRFWEDNFKYFFGLFFFELICFFEFVIWFCDFIWVFSMDFCDEFEGDYCGGSPYVCELNTYCNGTYCTQFPSSSSSCDSSDEGSCPYGLECSCEGLSLSLSYSLFHLHIISFTITQSLSHKGTNTRIHTSSHFGVWLCNFVILWFW